MKTMKKGTAILIAALVFGLSLAMFGFTSGLVKTAFAADGANVEMIGGASVKLNSTGIRFQSKVRKSYYDGLAEGKITGIAIIPADLLDGELNENTENAKIVKAVANPYEEGDYYVYNYALTDIPESSFGRSITARAFIKNGETYEWASNAQIRSLAYVASVALQKKSLGEATYNDAQTDILEKYIDGAVSGFTADNQQTLAVGDNVGISNLTITPKYAEDNLSDLKLVCTTNNADLSGKLLDVLDSAYKAIEKYETTDPNLYAAIKRRIDLEWLAPAKISLVDSNAIKGILSQKSRYEQIRTKFLKIVEETGISAASEFKEIQSLIDEINSVTL